MKEYTWVNQMPATWKPWDLPWYPLSTGSLNTEQQAAPKHCQMWPQIPAHLLPE